MSQRVTKCTVCGQTGHTRIHCLVMCGSCSGDSRKCDCQQPPAKKQKKGKGRRAAEQEQPQEAAAPGSPEAEPNYKSVCRQLQQKNQQLGKAYQHLKAKFDELEGNCQEREEQLAQAQQDADEMADLVRQNEQRLQACREQLKEKDERIEALEQQLRALQNSTAPSAANSHEAAAKVDRNDLAEIHRRYAAVLSTLNERKCSLNNAYRLAGTARSTIRDFIGIAELRIVNEVTYQSTLERLGDPKLSVKMIERECRRQLGDLLPLVKRLRAAKRLLPLALEDAFYS